MSRMGVASIFLPGFFFVANLFNRFEAPPTPHDQTDCGLYVEDINVCVCVLSQFFLTFKFLCYSLDFSPL